MQQCSRHERPLAYGIALVAVALIMCFSGDARTAGNQGGGFLYVRNHGQLWGYAINPDGSLAGVPGSPLSLNAESGGLAIHPSGRFLFTTVNQSVSIYTINSDGSFQRACPDAPAGSRPLPVAVDPTGQYVYVTNVIRPGSTIWGYGIDTTTGCLTPVTGSPFATGDGASAVMMHPLLPFAYVTNDVPHTIAGYNIDLTTGGLSPMAGSPFPGISPYAGLAGNPAGQFVYVTNVNSQSVSAYAIADDGSLSTISGSPFATGVTPEGTAVDPGGQFTYVVNADSNNISAYAINPDGSLTQVMGSPFATGDCPTQVTVDPSGQFVYAANYGCHTQVGSISAYAIDVGTGALTPVPGSPFATGLSTGSVQATSGPVASPFRTGQRTASGLR